MRRAYIPSGLRASNEIAGMKKTVRRERKKVQEVRDMIIINMSEKEKQPGIVASPSHI